MDPCILFTDEPRLSCGWRTVAECCADENVVCRVAPGSAGVLILGVKGQGHESYQDEVLCLIVVSLVRQHHVPCERDDARRCVAVLYT